MRPPVTNSVPFNLERKHDPIVSVQRTRKMRLVAIHLAAVLQMSTLQKLMGATGFEPEQDLAPLGLAGFESFADVICSSRPLVAK